jgi:hypothetical protein
MKIIVDDYNTDDSESQTQLARISLSRHLKPSRDNNHHSVQVEVDGNGAIQQLHLQLPQCRLMDGTANNQRNLVYDSGTVEYDMVTEIIYDLESVVKEAIYNCGEEWFGYGTSRDDIDSSFKSNLKLGRQNIGLCCFGGDEFEMNSSVIPLVLVDCISITKHGISIRMQLEQIKVVDCGTERDEVDAVPTMPVVPTMVVEAMEIPVHKPHIPIVAPQHIPIIAPTPHQSINQLHEVELGSSIDQPSIFKLLPPLKYRVTEYKNALKESIESQQIMENADKQQMDARKSNHDAMKRAELMKQMYKLSESDVESEEESENNEVGSLD